MSAGMLAAVAREGALITPVLTLTWPDQTRRYAGNPFVGPAGLAAPVTIREQIDSWGEVSEAASDEEFQLQTSSFRVTVADDDDDIAMRVARRYDLVGVVAALDLAVQGLASTDWLRAWTGILGDAPHQVMNARAFELELRNDDMPLQSFWPRHPIQPYDWPALHADARNKWAPIIYGIQDSRTLGGDGAVPLFYVKSDSNPFRYLLSQGWLLNVRVVYKDGSPNTAYTLVRGIVNGRAYTWIEYTSSQGAAVFTADVEGLDATGDATGALIVNSAAQAKHALVNYVYNEPATILSGGTPAWRSASEAPIAESTWDACATWLDGLVYTGDAGSMYFGGDAQSTGVQAINDFCKSALASVQFDNLGKLAAIYEDLKLAPATGFAQQLDYPTPEVGRTFHPITRREQLFSRAVARFGKLVTRDAQLQIECEELSRRFESTETLELPWGPRFA